MPIYNTSFSIIGTVKMKNHKGLTLIELLVTIAIIAVVAAISVPIVNNVIETSRNNAAAAMQTEIETFVEKHSESGQVAYDEASRTFTAWVDSDGDGNYSSPDEIVSTFAVPEEFYIDVDNFDSPANISVVPISGTHTLSYDINYDGGTDPASSTRPKGATLAVAASPAARSGYVFTGWNTNANGSGTSYAAGSSLTLNSNVTLYAVWTVNTFTVSYNYDGGTGGVSSETYTIGDPALTLPTPNRTGYTFDNWNTNANGSGTSYAAGSSLTPTANITLNAIWSAETYTVSFNYNGGTGGVASADYTVGDPGLTLPTPNRANHSFDGWYADQGLTGSPVTSPYTPAGNTTLHAKWTATSFVVFDASTGPNNAVTGGWNNFYTGGTTNSVMSVTSEYVALRGPYWTDGVAQTNNNIDMTGAKSITIVVSASGVSPSYFYSSFGWANTSGGYSGFAIGNPGNANFGLTTHTIPVTDAGNGKLRLYVTNSNGGYVYLYSVVINY